MAETAKHRLAARDRDPALEIFRGIAISEVVIHHVSGFARINIAPWTWSHMFYAVTNRTLHFAVPAFLFLMALVLTRAMGDGKRSWRDFYSRRAQQTLLPYLLWSVVYAGFSLWNGKILPADLYSPQAWAQWLVWGKAWYHLYFLVLALQLYLAFPLLLGALRRVRPGFGTLLAGGLALQAAIYLGHSFLPPAVRLPYPASCLLWHLPAVLTGIWVGMHLDQWDSLWRRWRGLALALLLGGLACYLPQGLRELRLLPIHGFYYQSAYWIYTLGVCLCLLAFCRFLARRTPRLARLLQVLGAHSMPIYVVHPMVLYFWYAGTHSGSTLRFHLTVLLAWSTALAVSLAVSYLSHRFGFSQILFGRRLPPLARLPSGGR